jgi:hypothetical protein
MILPTFSELPTPHDYVSGTKDGKTREKITEIIVKNSKN